jgi:hypothetical protein
VLGFVLSGVRKIRCGHDPWERIHSRKGRYIQQKFIVRNTAFPDESGPTGMSKAR